MADDEFLIGRGPERRSLGRQRQSVDGTENRYAAENPALDEMDSLFRERDERSSDLKALVTEESEVGPARRFSEDDFQAHFRGNEYARPHEPLRPVSIKKKKRKSEDGILSKRDVERLRVRHQQIIPEERCKEMSADEEHEDSPGGYSSAGASGAEEDAQRRQQLPQQRTAETGEVGGENGVAPLPSSDEAPLLDAGVALAAQPSTPDGKVKFSVGLDEADDDGDDGEVGSRGERRQRRHREQHVEDPSQRRQLGSERLPRRNETAPSMTGAETTDNGDMLLQDISSHRFDQSGPRRYKVKKKEDRSISNVIHLGDVNTGQTMLLGRKSIDYTPHDMFVELDELTETGNELEWTETARWIKYEEDVEQGGKRWGKPHLASISFQSLMSLRRCLERGSLLLDLEGHDSVAISHRIATQLVKDDMIKSADFGSIMRTLLLRRHHVGESTGRGGIRGYVNGRNLSKNRLQSLADIQNTSHTSLNEINDNEKKPEISTPQRRSQRTCSMGGESSNSADDVQRFLSHHNILRRMAPGTEVFSVNVGRVDFVDKPTSVFVRLSEGTFLPGITEVPLPVRFIFFLVVPSNSEEDIHETGRAFATLMSSPVFHEAAYKARSRADLMWALKDFLEETLVLPPIAWTNPDVLDVHELQRQSRTIQERKQQRLQQQQQAVPESTAPDDRAQTKGGADGTGDQLKTPQEDGDGDEPQDDPLIRVGRPFAGLIRDVKRRFPFYVSDFRDGLNPAVFSATFFIFFAALAGAITFGGLMMDKTELQIGISETLISTSMVGIAFALFSGQPLIIVGTTGPVLLFDEALYTFTKSNGLEYLPMRVWIAIWMLVVSLIVVGLEGSVFVKKFTQFTTEIFSSLVSILFVYESLSKLATVFADHPLMAEYCSDQLYIRSLPLMAMLNPSGYEDSAFNNTNVTTAIPDSLSNLTESMNSSLPAVAPLKVPRNQPNTAFLSLLLMFGTFFIANYLRQFRNSKFLGRRVRRMLGDFGVPIAILLMVALDQLMPMVYTQRLQVPAGLTPSDPELRGWFISPMGMHQPLSWIVVVGSLPAAGLIFIVIYMETMVCQLIMAKPERNLQKGTGFHLDIVLLSALNLVSALIGAPWMCAATIRSVSHVAALTMVSSTYAPGEKPRVLGVHEQRLSALIVSVLIGLSVVLSFVLKQIPVAVVFGIFMYMGFSSMTGVQLLERCVLFLKPVKHHGEEGYVRRVRTWRMHLFTVVQLSCLGFLLAIKFTPAAIGFPFFLAMLIPLRLKLLPRIFSEQEIAALDGGEDPVSGDDADFYEEAHQMPSTMSYGNLYPNSSLQLLRKDSVFMPKV